MKFYEMKGMMAAVVLFAMGAAVMDAQATWMRRVGTMGNMNAAIGGSIAYASETATSVVYANAFGSDAEFNNATYAIRGSWGEESTMADHYDTYVMTWVNSAANVYPSHPEYALPANTVGVGRMTPGNTAYWLDGYVLWKVQAPAGKTFTGGTATLTAHAEGMWNAGYLGKYQFRLFTDAPVIADYNITAPGTGTVLQSHFTQFPGGPGNIANYDENLSVTIPSGISSFYLMFDSNGAQNNATSYMKQLSINGTVVPEPATLALLLIGMPALLRRKR